MAMCHDKFVGYIFFGLGLSEGLELFELPKASALKNIFLTRENILLSCDRSNEPRVLRVAGTVLLFRTSLCEGPRVVVRSSMVPTPLGLGPSSI